MQTVAVSTQEFPHVAPAPSIIYVGGYGRSGSTILDAILGNQNGILGGGEMVDLIGKFHTGATERYDTDTLGLWGSALGAGLAAIGASKCAVTRLHRQFRRLESGLSVASKRVRQRHATFWRAALTHVASRESVHMVVDSSKSARHVLIRPILFRQHGLQVCYVLILRDPRAVLWSRNRGVNYLLEAGQGQRQNRFGLFRACLGWLGYTLAACIQYQFFKGRRCIVTYDDLVDRPVATCRQMACALNIDLDVLIDKLEEGAELSKGKGLAGNRTRRGSALVLKNDDEWRRCLGQLPLAARLMGEANAVVYRLLSALR